ncbi:long-chain-fatty-acid-- ligase [Fusarium albosuccineum]|uniref:Long-chain-fatty-acid-- ligase n=1 Tax=Fusarium albosuccineum TaxID=1237068 RepID=A0A8H4PBF7_9HYPO|nr:long-chain-fatty-acid-- ligase [Fusarium albosuccineum]
MPALEGGNNELLIEHPTPSVVRIILNRPKALNALNVTLLSSLVQALRDHANSRIIILEGQGDRSFCSGEDLKQTLAPETGSAEELRRAFDQLQDITRLTSSSRSIVIAAVQGFAIGGGAEIALAADFVIGGPEAKFRFPEVPIGHAATGGITLRLPYMVGLLKAKELLLTGRWVDAEEALRIGLLSEISPDAKARALELAIQLSELPTTSLMSSKTSLERSVFPNMENSLLHEVDAANHCFAQSDAASAYSNFVARKGNSATKNEHALGDGVRDLNTALELAVERFPNQPFIRFGGHDTAFLEFSKAVAALAGGLRESGVVAGDRVFVMMKNSVEMASTWFAVNRLGATWMPVNTELKSVTLKHVIEAALPKLAIIDDEFLPEFQSMDVMDNSSVYINGAASTEAQTLSSLQALGTPFESSTDVTAATTSAFLYTSGTTGKSKPCVLSHEYFILQAKALIEGCGLRGDDVLYCPLPMFHLDATALTIVPALLLGAVAALSVRYSASKFWDEIRATKATVYDYMGATLAITYKQEPNERDRDHSVRLAWGVPLLEFAPEYEKRFGHPLITLYGSVEAGLPVFQVPGKPLPKGSCGRVRKGYQLRIANDLGEEVPANTPGNVLVRSDSPNSILQGVDEDGNVYVLGRIKDVVRRRGENINASEVEEEFMQHPDVLMAAAYGVPSLLGEGTEDDLKVAVQLRPGSTADERGLWEWAVSRMARFQVPSVIELVHEIKQTPTCKLEKAGLPVEGGVRFDISRGSI